MIVGDKSWQLRAANVLYRPFPPILLDAARLRDHCPWFYTRAKGAQVQASDGRTYLDLGMGRGPNILGYAHEVIQSAIQEHVCVGAQTASLLNPAEVEVAELLVDLVPCAECVVFAKNGSDACTAAVRIARGATGKNVILSSGFHGYQDWYVAGQEGVEGLPVSYGGFVKTFGLNDLTELEQLAEAHAADLAGIIIEPAHHTLPEPGFLEAARDLAHHYRAVLIFDEVVTAFRLHLGGAQARYGVTPDLACLGKAMGNGYPLSALVGRRETLDHLSKTYFSMTFQHDSLGFAIARACLRYLRERNVPEVIAGKGEMLRTAFDSAALANGIPARALGFAGRMDFRFPPHGVLDSLTQTDLFGEALLERNVLPTPFAFPCEQLSETDVAQATGAFELGMTRIAQASDTGS